MRFMSMVKCTKESEAGIPPDPALIAAIGKMGEEAMRAGIIVDMGGLAPSSMGARVRASGGKVTVVDGPFTETKEIIGGYAILEVASKEEAIEEARKLMQVHLDILGPSYEGECEVRQLFTNGCAT
jgi:hypothetical protein